MKEAEQLAPMPVVLVDVQEKSERGFDALNSLFWGFVLLPLLIMLILGYFHHDYPWVPPLGFGESILARLLVRALFGTTVTPTAILKRITKKADS